MIELKLKNGSIHRFNLKNKDKEPSLRDAWYAMEDIENQQEKKLKINTDKNKLLIFKINEIAGCTHTDRPFLYSNDSLPEYEENPTNKTYENSYVRDDNEPKSTCTSPCITQIRPDLAKYEDSQIPPCIAAIMGGDLDMSELPDCARGNLKEVGQSIISLFSSVPNDGVDKLRKIISGVLELHLPFRFPDQLLTKICIKAMLDPSDNIDKYVDEYKREREKEL